VSAQIRALTQQRYLSGHTNDEATFKALMEAAHAQSQALDLQIGMVLSPEQIRQLKQDIVWLVTREVTLPDGQKHTVLVPQVYLAPSTQPTAVQGALVSAKRIVFKAQTLNNTGSTLLGQEGVHIEADKITNQRGQVASQGDL